MGMSSLPTTQHTISIPLLVLLGLVGVLATTEQLEMLATLAQTA